MPTIIPIPAFTDNYIWLIRDGAVVDPSDEPGGVVEAFAALRE